MERDLAALLVQTPYLLLLSIPGINVVSAAELAGEMGPIGNYARVPARSPAGPGCSRRGTRAIRWTAPAARWSGAATGPSARRS